MTPDRWPLAITPHEWQAEAYTLAVDALRSRRKPVIQACTGSGKSVLIAALCARVGTSPRVVDADEAIVVTTPTTGLVDQLAATITQHSGVTVGRYFTGRKDRKQRVIVCCAPSLPSLAETLRDYQRGTALWIADEVHRGLASKAKVDAVAALAPRVRFGLTATPWRTDAPIAGWDAPLLYSYGIREAIRDGVILPPHVIHTDVEDDVNDVSIAMLHAHAVRPVVVSARTIEDAREFAVRMTAEWAPTVALHSEMDDDAQVEAIEGLRTGRYAGLVHVKMLVEGADYPWLRTLLLRERRTALGLVQEVGRVLRVDRGDSSKIVGVVLDPLAQLPPTAVSAGSTLLKAAELGELIEAAEEEAEARQPFLCPSCGATVPSAHVEGCPEKPVRVVPTSVAVREAGRWIVELVDAAERAGLDVGPIRGGHDDASERQVATLRRWAASPRGPISCLPPNAREAVRMLAARPDRLTRYAASGLMSVGLAAQRRWIETAKAAGGGVPDWRRAWRWPDGCDVEPLDKGALAALTA